MNAAEQLQELIDEHGFEGAAVIMRRSVAGAFWFGMFVGGIIVGLVSIVAQVIA